MCHSWHNSNCITKKSPLTILHILVCNKVVRWSAGGGGTLPRGEVEREKKFLWGSEPVIKSLPVEDVAEDVID